MTELLATRLVRPQIEYREDADRRPRRRYTPATVKDIALQWRRFVFDIGDATGRVNRAAYGLSFERGGRDSLEYLSGVVVPESRPLPVEWSRASVPARRYAIFRHDGHVSVIPATIHAIREQWRPETGEHVAPVTAGVPSVVERYGEAFDPATGTGDVELWIPLGD